MNEIAMMTPARSCAARHGASAPLRAAVSIARLWKEIGDLCNTRADACSPRSERRIAGAHHDTRIDIRPVDASHHFEVKRGLHVDLRVPKRIERDRKSTRLNSSH